MSERDGLKKDEHIQEKERQAARRGLDFQKRQAYEHRFDDTDESAAFRTRSRWRGDRSRSKHFELMNEG
jgi:hypothetical protein